MGEKDKVQEIIEKSGNDLQFQVADYLSGHKWEVAVSPYYNDPATGKSREIDLIATRKWEIKDFLQGRFGELVIRLFIECKYIKDPAVFWFRQKNMPSAIKLAKDNRILRDKPDYYLDREPTIHHYIDNVEVAKRIAKGGSRDDIFDAMNQCLNALIFFTYDRFTPGPYCIDFPIIVTDSFQNLHKRDSTSSGYSLIDEPFQLEVDYSYKEPQTDGKTRDITKYFLIDIVAFEKLDTFLQDLEGRDIKLLIENLHWDLMRRISPRNSRRRGNDYI